MDKSITIAINKLVAGKFMLFVTEPSNWYIPIALFIVTLIALDWKKGLVATVAAALTLAVGDGLSAHLIKPFFARPRPCHDIPELITLAGCTASYSFPSNHAVNSFGIAMAFGLFYRPVFFVAIPLATLVAISRIGVGVHYFSDVVVGGLFGALIGYAIVRVMRAFNIPFQPSPIEESEDDVSSGIP